MDVNAHQRDGFTTHIYPWMVLRLLFWWPTLLPPGAMHVTKPEWGGGGARAKGKERAHTPDRQTLTYCTAE